MVLLLECQRDGTLLFLSQCAARRHQFDELITNRNSEVLARDAPRGIGRRNCLVASLHCLESKSMNISSNPEEGSVSTRRSPSHPHLTLRVRFHFNTNTVRSNSWSTHTCRPSERSLLAVVVHRIDVKSLFSRPQDSCHEQVVPAATPACKMMPVMSCVGQMSTFMATIRAKPSTIQTSQREENGRTWDQVLEICDGLNK